MTAARYWSRLADGRIRCEICPRYCALREGQRGLCFVRGVENGAMRLLTYGRSSGFCVDPIEKKPLNHFLPGTPVLSFGTAGCNLTCKFCQNWDISKARAFDALGQEAPPERIAAAALEYGCRSVAFTYNDPVIFHEYAVDVATACRAAGVASVAVTAGYQCAEPREAFFAVMDAANIDLKAFTERFYRDLCAGGLEAVKETLTYLARETAVWVEVTVLLIPGENDGAAEITALSEWMLRALGPDVPLHFTAFHPDYKMRDRARTPPERLFAARRLAKEIGMRHVYVGNFHDVGRQSSYCAGCGLRVIERDWHQLSAWRLDAAGACAGCGEPFPGRIEAEPGNWGRRRMPVTLSAPVMAPG